MCAKINNIYLFISCAAHSGSTLLALLLATHPRITSVGELRPMNIPKGYKIPECSCGAPIEECTFWRNVDLEMEAKGHSFLNSTTSIDFSRFWVKIQTFPLGNRIFESLRKHVFNFVANEKTALDKLARFHQHVAESALLYENTDIFADATKSYYLFNTLAQRLEFRERMHLKLIHLVRDVRGVAFSVAKRRRPQDWDKTIEIAAKYWVRANQAVHLIQRAYMNANDVFLLRYSDLCHNPEASIEQLSRFIGVTPKFLIGDIDNTQYHIFGNEMRKIRLKEIREDTQWQEKLSQSDLRTIKRIAGRMSQKYGVYL